ncbi:hypothetical protein ACTXMV_01335 [Psychrobacter celer]|uniref:hypothetical protein n=1 Tax=Psychrobacter TaxID=497 RepID=UPI000EDDE319|nr:MULTISPECIES: hypothetical protein [Psychrobacter]HCH27440.1 hypothetical protein [Psychrobacter sp.]
MRKIALFIGAMSVATVGFCGVGQFSGDTTCYVYKQDKLQKKLTCQYDGAEGAAMSYAFRQVDYNLPGFGKMATSNSADYDDNSNHTGWTTTVNDEPAVIRYRAPSSKKVVSQTYAESGKKVLQCYLSTTSQWEICSE